MTGAAITSDDPVIDAGALIDGLPLAGLSAGETYRLLEERSLGDGLPVCAADPALVSSLVTGIPPGLPGDDLVAVVPPLGGELTAQRLAVCAALAGCLPRHMPVVRAAVGALIDPDLNAYGVLTTTGSAALVVIVNGPVRASAGFNSSANCLGPGSRANATVGRCLSLVVRFLGGAREGVADMATLGQPAKYTCCFAENEEASPWPALHVERGIAADCSAATVMGISGIVEVFESVSMDPLEMVRSLTPGLAAAPVLAHTPELIGGGQPLVILSPEWAAAFAQAGLNKDDVKRMLFEEGRHPLDHRARVSAHPGDLVVVVAGGAGLKQAVMPNWNGGSRAVTVALSAP